MRTIINLAQRVRVAYWRLFKPTTFGVRAIVIDQHNYVILVRHRYSKGWYLPGGGKKKSETQQVSLERELKEELKVSPINNAVLVGTYKNSNEYKNDTVYLFTCNVNWSGNFDRFELEEATAFPLDKLPADTSPATMRRLVEYKSSNYESEAW
jgi:ADP-ribose pyrophosphatase YjhB (NUDIX family)